MQFLHKKKLQSEIFNHEKSLYTKLFFSVITKNLNWEIVTKNLVFSEDRTGLRMKNYNIWGFTKKFDFYGVSRKANI